MPQKIIKPRVSTVFLDSEAPRVTMQHPPLLLGTIHGGETREQHSRFLPL